MEPIKPCVPGFLHKFKTLEVTFEWTKEYCERCFLEYVVLKAADGQHETNVYREYHARDFLQTYESEYFHEFPNKIRQF